MSERERPPDHQSRANTLLVLLRSYCANPNPATSQPQQLIIFTKKLIMAVFNWDYLSFYDYDITWLYREVVFIPVLIVVLWFIWMKVVR